MIIEIEFDSLAEARAMGPQAVLDRCVRDGLRLLESPTYCERNGRGVLSVEVAEGGVFDIASHAIASRDTASDLVAEPGLVSAAKVLAQLAAAAGVAASATSDQPAASVAVQPEIDQ